MKNKLIILAILAGFCITSAIGQNVIIQQNSNIDNNKSQDPVPPKPKESLGIGILELTNRECLGCNPDNYRIIKALYIKSKDQLFYSKINYCELLRGCGMATNLFFEEGMYDIKITVVTPSGVRCSGDYLETEYYTLETKNILIKKDYITKISCGGKAIRAEIPKAM